jgi:hypothetical protein
MLTTTNADDNAFVDQYTDDEDDCDCKDFIDRSCGCSECESGTDGVDVGERGSGDGSEHGGHGGHGGLGPLGVNGNGRLHGSAPTRRPRKGKRKIPLVLNVTNTVTSSNGGSTTGTSTGSGTGAGSTGGSHDGRAHSGANGNDQNNAPNGPNGPNGPSPLGPHHGGPNHGPCYPYEMRSPRHLIDGTTLVIDRNGKISANIDNKTIKYKTGHLRATGTPQEEEVKPLTFPLQIGRYVFSDILTFDDYDLWSDGQLITAGAVKDAIEEKMTATPSDNNNLGSTSFPVTIGGVTINGIHQYAQYANWANNYLVSSGAVKQAIAAIGHDVARINLPVTFAPDPQHPESDMIFDDIVTYDDYATWTDGQLVTAGAVKEAIAASAGDGRIRLPVTFAPDPDHPASDMIFDDIATYDDYATWSDSQLVTAGAVKEAIAALDNNLTDGTIPNPLEIAAPTADLILRSTSDQVHSIGLYTGVNDADQSQTSMSSPVKR